MLSLQGDGADPWCAGSNLFDVVTVLRDPVARLVSQLERSSPRPNSRLAELTARPWHFNTSERSSLFGTASLDNYLTRLLLGPSAFFLPLRSINASHLEAATRVLDSFTAAVPIEELHTGGAQLLRALLGWRGAPLTRNSHAGHHQQAAANRTRVGRAPPRLGERSLRLLRALNRYDLQLIARARARFREHTELVRRGEARRAPRPLQGAAAARPQQQCPQQCPTGKTFWHPGQA